MKELFNFNKNGIIKRVVVIIIALLLLLYSNMYMDGYKIRILNLCLINVILALSLNLINGFAGLFSLGHAGFMAVGAYVVAILTLSPEMKEVNYYMHPINPALLNLNMPFILAVIMGGLVAGVMGFLIAFPVLRLNDDYLAIASLGFAEIIRIVFINIITITNGALGLKGIPTHQSLLSTGGFAIATVILISLLVTSSYGKALLAIREDEIAARSMGINLFKHKLMSFTIGSMFAGIGGGLLAVQLGTIDPSQFRFALTFNILLIVVLGGMGKIKGTIIAAFFVTMLLEYLRVLDEPMNNFLFKTNGLPGLRMVVFSLLLIIVIIFKRDDMKIMKIFRRKKYVKS